MWCGTRSPARGRHRRCSPTRSAITGLAFDPTGRRLATAGYSDGTVKMWFATGLQQEGPRLATDPGATSAVAFDPGGKHLLSSGHRWRRRVVWPRPPAWPGGGQACSLAGRNLTRAEWAQLVSVPALHVRVSVSRPPARRAAAHADECPAGAGCWGYPVSSGLPPYTASA